MKAWSPMAHIRKLACLSWREIYWYLLNIILFQWVSVRFTSFSIFTIQLSFACLLTILKKESVLKYKESLLNPFFFVWRSFKSVTHYLKQFGNIKGLYGNTLRFHFTHFNTSKNVVHLLTCTMFYMSAPNWNKSNWCN